MNKDELEELQLAPQQQVNLFADALEDGDDATVTSDVHPFLAHMGFAPVSLDALQARCRLDTATLQA
jgi:DNA processing protein